MSPPWNRALCPRRDPFSPKPYGPGKNPYSQQKEVCCLAREFLKLPHLTLKTLKKNLGITITYCNYMHYLFQSI
jgi:hypothetical protein